MMAQDDVRIKEPPVRLLAMLRFLGPGLILSAAIVGSGELIVTTALGARAGFTFLWIILFGCIIKVIVQLEYGRFCICHGLPTFQAWNHGDTRKLFRIHWTIVVAFLFLLSMFIGLAGVLGGAAQVAYYAIPGPGIAGWTAILALSLALMVFQGKYRLVEGTATVLNLIFVIAIVLCVVAVQNTRYAFGLSELGEGLSLTLPRETMALALGAFGITGVGAAEIFTYPYWCLEKGYALWTGPRNDSDEWARRARGWIRVMTVDALFAMVVYTVATCAFYLLGAAVLRPQPELADGNELILQLSQVFTRVLGDGTMLIFMICAFTVLFSTIFSNTAAYARLWTDFFAVAGLISRTSERQRLRSIAIMAWILPLVWTVVYLSFQRPLYLVIFMGIANAVFLFVVAYKALIFRYRQTDDRLKPVWWYDIFLWISVLSVALMAGWALVNIWN